MRAEFTRTILSCAKITGCFRSAGEILEETLRFYALRLHEAGLIESSPNNLIAEHADWRFLDEVKRELKA